MNDEVVICLIFLGEFVLDSQNKSLSLIKNMLLKFTVGFATVNPQKFNVTIFLALRQT